MSTNTAPTPRRRRRREGQSVVDNQRGRSARIDTWQRAWAEFVPFLDFPIELRTIVYTTNAIESLNARFRKAVRHRGPSLNPEQAALKVLYLVATERRPNRSNPTGKINAWKKILNTLTIHTATGSPPPTDHAHARIHKQSDSPHQPVDRHGTVVMPSVGGGSGVPRNVEVRCTARESACTPGQAKGREHRRPLGESGSRAGSGVAAAGGLRWRSPARTDRWCPPLPVVAPKGALNRG